MSDGANREGWEPVSTPGTVEPDEHLLRLNSIEERYPYPSEDGEEPDQVTGDVHFLLATIADLQSLIDARGIR